MTIQELELDLKKISSDFDIRVNPNSPEIAGVYWKGYCTYIALPAKQIFPTRNESFRDEYGNVHRGADQVLAMSEGFLKRIETDAEYKDLITTDDARENVLKKVIKVK